MAEPSTGVRRSDVPTQTGWRRHWGLVGGRQLTLVVCLVALMAVGAMAITEWSFQRAGGAMSDLMDSSVSRAAVQTVLTRLTDAESAQRGYLLTDRARYLDPYRHADADVRSALSVLNREYPANSDAHRLVLQVAERAEQKLSEMALSVKLHDEGRHDAWRGILMTDIGRDGMDDIRALTARLLQADNEHIAASQHRVLQTLQIGRWAVLCTTLVILVGGMLYVSNAAALDRAQREHLDAVQQAHDRLEEQVRARTFDIGLVHEHQQAVRDDERLMLARALHDELGGLLTAAKLDIARLRRTVESSHLELLPRVDHLRDILDEGIAVKRRAIEELMPSPLHQLGLSEALQQLVADFRAASSTEVQETIGALELDATRRNVCYQFIKECLQNIRQHANASKVELSVVQSAGEVLLQVHDNGQGFDPEANPRNAFGLKSLRYRLQMLGGQLTVQSAPGQGSHVLARIQVLDSAAL